ncbi:MAG: methyltransferase [Deferribacteres bacterium]|nr:methyltransferase [candidate division KSB1 bacterium]MCB9501075.1 methyltransferase [Deferribacteres bacterium]
MSTPREIVKQALTFQYPERLPRDLWTLPCAEMQHPDALAALRTRYPSDFQPSPNVYAPSQRRKGDPYKIGQYTDEWGCVFNNKQNGIIGEVKEPLLNNIADWRDVRPPKEILEFNHAKAFDTLKRFYGSTDGFVMAGTCPRPWEQYQFLRGTENAMVDLLLEIETLKRILKIQHDFYLSEIEFWAEAAVDAIGFMDDWGTQKSLLVSPELWREIFKPLYKEYCEAIHAGGKFVFMHSDGDISTIYPDLIEIGVDAINSQLFVMDFDFLRQHAKGKITFWGEIDRQYILTSADPQISRTAVRKVAESLYDPAGGIIAQFEFGAGAHPNAAVAVYEEWEKIHAEIK